MDLFVYDTPYGPIADFRPYLDGKNHYFDDAPELPPGDPRWEKIRGLMHPEAQADISGDIVFLGRAVLGERWKELTRFPIAWAGEYETAEAGGAE